jgi:DNA repair exonuclease SbcCD ATPase subunit
MMPTDPTELAQKLRALSSYVANVTHINTMREAADLIESLTAEKRPTLEQALECVSDAKEIWISSASEHQRWAAIGMHDLIAARLTALYAAPTPAEPSEEVDACPCKHTTPCSTGCTCAFPWSSHGCERCCSYGSAEQQKAMAEHLASRVSTAGEVERLKEDVELLGDIRSSQGEMIKKLKAELSDAQSRIDWIEEDRSNVGRRKNQLQNEVCDLRKERDSLTAKVDQLQVELANAKMAEGVARGEAAGLAAKVAELERELESLTSDWAFAKEVRSVQVRSVHDRSGQVRSVQVRSVQVRTAQARSVLMRSNDRCSQIARRDPGVLDVS